MTRPLVAALLLLCCAAAYAQEIDVYDPTDFIDPRDRGVVFRPGRFGVTDNGSMFSLTRVYGGRVFDYQWRNNSTGANLSFLHAATSFYRGDKQLNVKLTAFDADNDAAVPNFRATVQAGQYLLGGKLSPDAPDDQRIAGRVLVIWSVERNPYDRDGAVRRDRFNHEFGVQTDVQVPLPKQFGKLEKLDGSFIWMRRRIDERTYVDRLSYLYRLRERQRSNGRLQLNASVGFGAERADGWHCCLARGVFTATFIVPRINVGVNAAFAPTFAPAGEGRRTHHELALYLDRTAIARIADLMVK